MNKIFNLEIYTPDRIFFKGEAESLVVNTDTGEMGILYQTLPIVTTLASGVMRILHNEKWMEAISSTGFINVSRSVVTVLVESAFWPHEIDMNDIETELSDEQLQQRKNRSFNEYKMVKAQLASQFAKLKAKDRKF